MHLSEKDVMNKLNNYQRSVLKNGLEVITDYMPSVETVCLGVWNDVGSRHETKDINGIAHLLEHMVFKGTPTRSALDIAQSVDDRGAHINAYTSKENTAYFIRSLAQDLDFSIELIADIIQNPLFPEDELEREKGVVLQEIGMYLDTPDDLIYDDFALQAYGDTPFGRNILGPCETVKSIQSYNLREYLKSFYHSKSMKVVAAGKVNHDSFCKKVEDLFISLPQHNEKNIFKKAQYQGGLFCRQKDLEQVHMVLGFDSCSYTHADAGAVQMLASILGGGDSSRIYQEVREKRGLAYSTYALQDSARDTGTFMIYAGTGADECFETFDVICSEIEKIKQEGISIEELNRAKAQKKSGLIMSAESSYARADRAGRHAIFYPELKDLSESVSLYEAISIDDVMRVATDILSSKPTVSMLGSLEGNIDQDLVKKRMGL